MRLGAEITTDQTVITQRRHCLGEVYLTTVKPYPICYDHNHV